MTALFVSIMLLCAIVSLSACIVAGRKEKEYMQRECKKCVYSLGENGCTKWMCDGTYTRDMLASDSKRQGAEEMKQKIMDTLNDQRMKEENKECFECISSFMECVLAKEE